uniref:F-actin-capping protein subunit alpha n=1 Tax=Leptobrachium leishanense TaxID=445787 RepID=A0A8C5P930_9ANUR
MMSKDLILYRSPKIKAACNLLMKAPPVEFNNVCSNIRFLLNNDSALCRVVKRLCAKHNKENFTPVELEGLYVLITCHNELNNNRFLDPVRRISFKFNHLTKQANYFMPMPVQGREEAEFELWRCAFQDALDGYIIDHYPNGVCNVFCNILSGERQIVACIEANNHSKSSFWNGLWKSEWVFLLRPPVTSLLGSITIQANYYETGSFNLTCTSSVEENLSLMGMKEAAQAFAEIVEKSDNKMQAALIEEYDSGSSMKSLRRQLSFIRSTLDWNSISFIGKETLSCYSTQRNHETNQDNLLF